MSELSGHLESVYGIAVAGLTPLDRRVLRVDRADGPAWVARLFGPERPIEAVEGDATILRRLAEAGLPAERVAGPVSTMDGHAAAAATRFRSPRSWSACRR